MTTDIARIPLIDIGTDGPVALAEALRDRMLELRESVLHGLPGAASRIAPYLAPAGDRLNRAWMRRTDSEYLPEIEAISEILGVPGAYAINGSYQWGCTTRADGATSRMHRVLDWPFVGLGAGLVIAHQVGAAGPYLNVTWPGAVGVLTAMAPGRFAGAINMAPQRRLTRPRRLKYADQAVTAAVTFTRVRDIPPDHLLRRAFDRAGTFEEAVDLISTTRAARPALFSLVGVEEGQSCVIEHRGTEARVIRGPVTVGNDWQVSEPMWQARGTLGVDNVRDSADRVAMMASRLPVSAGSFDWLVPPVLNGTTRVAAEMDPRTGTLDVRGYEPDPRDRVAPALLAAASGPITASESGRAR